MPQIKITEMPEMLPYDEYTSLGGIDPGDYLAIIDSSESDPALKNKKVAISTVFEKYLDSETVKQVIINCFSMPSVLRMNVIDNSFVINANSASYLFLNPDEISSQSQINRDVQVNFSLEGTTKVIKNTSAGSNTITLQNLLMNNITTFYEIEAGETVRVIFDGYDHHIMSFPASL